MKAKQTFLHGPSGFPSDLTPPPSLTTYALSVSLSFASMQSSLDKNSPFEVGPECIVAERGDEM